MQFRPGGESLDTANQKAAFDIQDDDHPPPPRPKPLQRPRSSTATMRRASPSAIGRHRSPERISERSEDITDSPTRAPLPPTRPSIFRSPSSGLEFGHDPTKENKDPNKKVEEDNEEVTDEIAAMKVFSQQTAQDRAGRLQRVVDSHSAPGSRYSSPQRPPTRIIAQSPPPSPPLDGESGMPFNPGDLSLKKLKTPRTKFGIEDDTDEEDEGEPCTSTDAEGNKRNRLQKFAADLVKPFTKKERPNLFKFHPESQEFQAGTQTPVYGHDSDDHAARPPNYGQGYLSLLLQLVNEEGVGSALAHIPAGHDAVARAVHRNASNTLPLLDPATPRETPATTPATTPGPSPVGSPTSSGTNTPRPKHQKWYYKNSQSQSTGALSDLVSSSTVFAQPGGSKQTSAASDERSAVRPKAKQEKRPRSSHAMDTLGTVLGKKKKTQKKQNSIEIQVHIAEIGQRKEYLLRVCDCLMEYGAPTHRLEGDNDPKKHQYIC